MNNPLYLLTIGILVYSCSASSTDNYSKASGLNAQNSELIAESDIPMQTLMLTSSSSSGPSENVIIDGIDFTVVLNEQGDTTYWSTEDLNFKTPEGYYVGAEWESIAVDLQNSVERMPGWGYYIRLDSDWQLGFCEEATCTDEAPTKGSKVSWIFRREK